VSEEGSFSRTVLVIDDEEMIRNIVKRILKFRGHEAIEAKSGDEALEIVSTSTQNIDYAILDLSMPGLSGAETFKKLREIKRDLKIIIATGFVGSSESQQFLDEGAIAILEKPFKMDQLIEIIK
jgi:DNA-binding NtrC family response regulator